MGAWQQSLSKSCYFWGILHVVHTMLQTISTVVNKAASTRKVFLVVTCTMYKEEREKKMLM